MRDLAAQVHDRPVGARGHGEGAEHGVAAQINHIGCLLHDCNSPVFLVSLQGVLPGGGDAFEWICLYDFQWDCQQ